MHTGTSTEGLAGTGSGPTAGEPIPPVASVRPPPPEAVSGGRLRRAWRANEPLLLSLLSVIAVLALWEVAATEEWINPTFFSRPTDIWSTFVEMYVESRSIYHHIGWTLRIGTQGFVYGLVVGILLGALLGSIPRVRYVVEPWVTAAYVTPTVAFLPLFILWLGIGDSPKILLVFLGAVFPILINTQAGIQNTDHDLVETARSFGASGRQLFVKVTLPGALPYVLAGVRLAIGRTLIMTFVAELFLSNKGLGFLVSDAGAKFRSAEVFVGVITLALLGVIITQIVRIIERRLIRA